MANSCNMKLLKDDLIAKPHEMSFQLMSRPERDRKREKVKKLILIKTRSIVDPEDYVFHFKTMYILCLLSGSLASDSSGPTPNNFSSLLLTNS